MLGMDHNQRSNAVGSQPSYLPSGDTGRDGGGTYSGQATEPTVQDYENFFGPSARDIKTDLQRYKRHGRWHLPDILQGPNPWLTDRIDGLITDATNSPFTTKILPYRYKEDVDGKIKWNVWSFDEGMASRVPYESAARTLTQSKRSFAGYMVRQGMAITLEHNFMMTPKGRENFKNQLNQLIGSIQYTNDLDVHMALILAPSYQKTMSERYYSTDKSPGQMCREFVDLFGMMQKNVNALDILIEESKAILRTWGSPMPDFLLCNSKLTFQMTMTPEKTNYITQGIDGVKRLRQGPDLGSYRGLNVIHTRSFAMEVGQHPRDVLRRRVRTAEYYRILPNKKNVNREFEFYNEERDTWFTLSFQELLRCARYIHDDGSNDDNAALIDGVYHGLSAPAVNEQEPQRLGQNMMVAALGAYRKVENQNIPALDAVIQNAATSALDGTFTPIQGKTLIGSADIRAGTSYQWSVAGLSDPLGVQYVEPRDNEAWDEYKRDIVRPLANDVPERLAENSLTITPLTPRMLSSLYSVLKGSALNDPFVPGRVAAPGTDEWQSSFLFYLELIKRKGLPLQLLDVATYNPANATQVARINAMMAIPLLAVAARPAEPDIVHQVLSLYGAVGSVNNPLNLFPSVDLNVTPVGQAVRNDIYANLLGSSGRRVGTKLILTYELLQPLLSEYTFRGRVMKGIDLILELAQLLPARMTNGVTRALVLRIEQTEGILAGSIDYTLNMGSSILNFIQTCLDTIPVQTQADGATLCNLGINTIPLTMTSMTHMFHPLAFGTVAGGAALSTNLRGLSRATSGHLNFDMLRVISVNAAGVDHVFMKARSQPGGIPAFQPLEGFLIDFFTTLRNRMFMDPCERIQPLQVATFLGGANHLHSIETEHEVLTAYMATLAAPNAPITPVARIAQGRVNMVLDLNEYFDTPLPNPFDPPYSASEGPKRVDLLRAQDIEIVVVRPNIEHNMLGVIMGLGGDDLGNTLWGQTELSVYDDSMHGIWGMSYKYHERAIVFNEKNLVRLWDIAYDGYNGGKDDTYVDWTAGEDAPNGSSKFKQHTLDLGNNYRGPSMMVMAFAHDKNKRDADNQARYEGFKRNWPSPIVFYDSYNPANPRTGNGDTLPLDYDNLQTVNVEDFRVFNNSLYHDAYSAYKRLMPDFRTLHITRKSAGQGSADAETATDCLAFQGSMRVKELGQLLQSIDGSGHHGPDYTGVASVRAGKGQKSSGAAPTLHRLI